MEAWLQRLADECEAAPNQGAVARAIGYSPTVVSQVLNGRYPGDLGAVEAAVRGAFFGATVECPVLGELPENRCLEEQRRRLLTSSPQRVQLYRACRAGCPHSRIGGERC